MTRACEPQPIRTTPDNDFAHATMTTRLPKNIRNVVAEHPEYPRAIARNLEELASAIESDAPIPSIGYPAWDAETWHAAWRLRAGRTWHDVDWFFGETYAFRLLLSAVRYFENRVDPFGPVKQRELRSGSPFLPVERFFGAKGPGQGLAGVRRGAPRAGEADRARVIEDALHLSMWGNKADISFTAGGALDHSAGDRKLLLADDGARAAEHLARATATVHVITDNSGAELAGDLVLALVIHRTTGASVTMHVKFYPTYVSDTTPEDVQQYLRFASRHDNPVVADFASELGGLIDEGTVTLAPDPYWCGTEFLTELPPRLFRLLAGGAMTIVKGDFNYRRAMRDTTWRPDTPLPAAMGLEQGATYPPWLFLRTMKSDVIAGIDASLYAELDGTAPGWRTDGKRGVIQLVSAAASAE